MKKTLCIIIPTIAIVLIVGVCFGLSVIHSPEYALLQIAEDVEKSGVDGLMPHLTEEAQETVATITSITESDVVSSVFSFFGNDDYIGIFKSNLKEVEWRIYDVLKGKKSAEVVLRFNYKDNLIGTIGLKMVFLENTWKINSIDMPCFEKVDFEN